MEFAGLDLTDRAAADVRWEECRLVGTDLAGTRLDRAHLVDYGCRVDLASFRFTSFTAVLFENCLLAGADFAAAKLGGARFVNCDLTGARFSEAQMRGTEFSGCTLVDIDGITNFTGSIIDGHDLIALSYALAGGLGIQIRD